MAGTLWGDREGSEPTGFLLKPPPEFASPPHIHNISYRGVVIEGVIHNDDTNAKEMWMPAGSFWTQPKGEVHITSAEGSGSLAYIEIEEGPYLVLPEEEAFDSGERPANVDKSNLVWLNAADVNWVDVPSSASAQDGPKIAFLWGDTSEGALNGSFIKLPAGFDGSIHSLGSSLGAVVIKGPVSHAASEKALESGSYFSSKGESLHALAAHDNEVVLYVRTNGKYTVQP
tara:strand:- start:1872 stop:2558 length:687 start_codon:yes stop_codon:yes gene_type:complete